MEVTFNINIYAIIFISLLVIVISTAALTVFFNRKGLKEIDETSKNDLKLKRGPDITKKDMAYWLIFLVIFGILWVSSSIYDNKDFTDYVSFSGTVTSIVLGVVAIVYSFFQSFDSANTKESLLGVSNSLKLSSDEIKQSTNKVEGIADRLIELNDSVENIVKDVKCVSEEMKKSITSLELRLENVETKVDETNNNIHEIRDLKYTPNDWNTNKK